MQKKRWFYLLTQTTHHNTHSSISPTRHVNCLRIRSMENSDQRKEQIPFSPNPNSVDDDEIDEQEEEEEEEEDDVVSHKPYNRKNRSSLSSLREQRSKLETLSRRLASELVPIRVHDVLIRGNTKTKDWVIEAELKLLQDATTVQELISASEIALARLRSLEIFESTELTLQAGPPELPHTANVVVDVVETANKVSGEFGVYTKPSVQSHSLFSFRVRCCDCSRLN